jgi:hypothetical protein
MDGDYEVGSHNYNFMKNNGITDMKSKLSKSMSQDSKNDTKVRKPKSKSNLNLNDSYQSGTSYDDDEDDYGVKSSNKKKSKNNSRKNSSKKDHTNTDLLSQYPSLSLQNDDVDHDSYSPNWNAMSNQITQTKQAKSKKKSGANHISDPDRMDDNTSPTEAIKILSMMPSSPVGRQVLVSSSNEFKSDRKLPSKFPLISTNNSSSSTLAISPTQVITVLIIYCLLHSYSVRYLGGSR